MPTVIGGNTGGNYEVVENLEWIRGKFTKLETRVNDNKEVTNNKTGEKKKISVNEARFFFSLEGHKEHNTKWLTQSMNEKSNLYKMIILGIDPTIKPNSIVDIDNIIGLECKFMFESKPRKDGQGAYQFVSKIKIIEGQEPTLLIKQAEEQPEKQPEKQPEIDEGSPV